MLIDRACAYGDGLFETIAIRDGKPRLWSAHLARLQTGCMRLGLECPSSELLLELLDIELNASAIGSDFASARVVVSAAASARGYRRNPEGDCVTDITLYPAKPLARSLTEKGIATRMCSSRLAIQPALAGIKTLNRLEQVIARSEWKDDEILEGLMCDTDGRLICGTMSNVFLIKGSRVFTPAITRCGVSGVMRAHVLQLLEEAGHDCAVRDVMPEELHTATALFLSNSQFGILPIRRCDSHQFDVGSSTREIQSLLAANGVPECSF
jgi:4-amino-4-deoxychorismate lyase